MTTYAQLLLRAGIGFVFIYAGVSSFLEPLNWVGFFPQFLRSLVPQNILLPAFSLYELGIGIWLLFGKNLFLASFLAAVSLLSIVIFNFGSFDILFRDLGLFFAALALVFLSR